MGKGVQSALEKFTWRCKKLERLSGKDLNNPTSPLSYEDSILRNHRLKKGFFFFSHRKLTERELLEGEEIESHPLNREGTSRMEKEADNSLKYKYESLLRMTGRTWQTTIQHHSEWHPVPLMGYQGI